MKSSHCLRWSRSVLTSRARVCSPICRYQCRRTQSTAAVAAIPSIEEQTSLDDVEVHRSSLPSPPPSLAKSSARLNALHARLSLPQRFPVETLARCLITSSADPNTRYNNGPLAILGAHMLEYYTTEAVICRYPRLPTEVVDAAISAYHGHKTLASLSREWGVEAAAAPGGEVDPGLLQFRRVVAGNASVMGTGLQVKELYGGKITSALARRLEEGRRKAANEGTEAEGLSSEKAEKIGADAAAATFTQIGLQPDRGKLGVNSDKGITLQSACSLFVHALFGAYYLHNGLAATKRFHEVHIMSRHLDYSSLFYFQQPTRDLSRLCAREDFIPPVARILAETGRKSRHPVYVVGVFSGREKLGEGSGASLHEARARASINALKGWYLYSPLEVRVPSSAKEGEVFPPCMIDGGEVIV